MNNDNKHHGSFSRREMLKGLSVASLYSTMGGTIALPVYASAAQKISEPKYGGRIRVATVSSSTADTLDPAKASLSTDYARLYMLYGGLTRYDEKLDAQLFLAESIDSEDQITWQIKIRSGITFHDGKSLTSADVVYSLLRHQDPKVASKAAVIAAQFSDVKTTGPLSLSIQLTGANADLPVIFASANFLIVQDGYTNFQTAVGTGPYQLKDFNAGVRTLVEKNPNYWQEGKPYLDEIELIGISDESSRVNALLAGDIHLVTALNPRSTKRIRKSGTHDVMQTESGLYTNLIMRQDAFPTNNPDFVLGMKYLFDRELIKRALFRGYASIANDHPVPPNHKYYAADIPQRSYDLDKATFHLKKAGMIGARLPIFASPAAEGSVDMAALLQLRGIEAGFKLAINRVPADGYWSNHWMKHPLGFGNINPRSSMDVLFSLFYKSDAPWNESGWSNPKFDQLLVAARGEGDQQKRKQMYTDMQYLVSQHCGVGIPVFLNLIDGFDKRVKGLTAIPTGGLMGYNFADSVWLDA